MKSIKTHGIKPTTFTITKEGTNELFDIYAHQAYELKQAIAAYRKELDALTKKLQRIANGNAIVTQSYAYTFVERKGNVNYGAIPELASVDLEAYRKSPVKAWSLTKVG